MRRIHRDVKLRIFVNVFYSTGYWEAKTFKAIPEKDMAFFITKNRIRNPFFLDRESGFELTQNPVFAPH